MSGPEGPAQMDVDSVQGRAVGFELDAYISNYSGFNKIERLRFIASRALGKPLELDALKLAADHLKLHTDNHKAYLAIMEAIDGRLGPQYTVDDAWIETVQASSHRLREKLEDDLSAAKTNSIRESIRRGQMDLGDYFRGRGEFMEASKCYMRSRDCCNTPKQMLSFCLAIIRTYIHASNWTMVTTYVQKAEEIPDAKDDKSCSAKLHAAAGLACLLTCKYPQAAQHFTSVEPELGSTFDDVIAGQDIAIYGALAALASLERKDIRAKCLNRFNFSYFMEAVPQVRELLEAFCTSNYVDAFRVLADLQLTLQYDIYLAGQLDALVQRIRCRALKQYTVPFDALRIPLMAQSFAVDETSLEKELVELIVRGEIHARIDSQSKILWARQNDQRRTTVANIVAAADSYIANSRALLLRNQVMKNGLVPAVEGEGAGAGAMFGNQFHEGRQLGWGGRRGGLVGEVGGFVGNVAGFMGNIVGRSNRGGQ